MKTVLKAALGIAIIFALAFSLNLYNENAVLDHHSSVKNETATDAQNNVSQTVPARTEPSLKPKKTKTPNAADNHKGDNQGHVKDSIFGYKISDLIALIAALTAIGFGIFGLRQNRISNEKQNRAYVFIKECKVLPINETIEGYDEPQIVGYKVQTKIMNGGQTPAKNLRGNVWLSMSNDYNARVTKDSNPWPIRPIYLAPSDYKVSIIGLEKADCPPTTLYALLENNLYLRMYGELTYIDEFGNPQEISFRFKSSESQSFLGEMTVADDGLIST